MHKESFGENYEFKNKALFRRYTNTLRFLKKHIDPKAKILDLGVENPLSKYLIDQGFDVSNTEDGLDLDTDYQQVNSKGFDVVTSFELFEHMVAPFNILRNLESEYLVASVPLKLWFAEAYWNEKDPWDRHYHEFEPKQFDMLLEKSGWTILDREQWTSHSNGLGIRPILRRFTPRYYIVYCQRSKS
ncbi:MAG: methyltransferase [Bacteroidetes bacterium]|nr:MAG: methyltransferase [Bacteroidota bacterium]